MCLAAVIDTTYKSHHGHQLKGVAIGGFWLVEEVGICLRRRGFGFGVLVVCLERLRSYCFRAEF